MVRERLEVIFRDVLPEEQVPVERMTKAHCSSWDSLHQLSLILAIEQEFQIRISDADAAGMNSFEGAVEIVSDSSAGH